MDRQIGANLAKQKSIQIVNSTEEADTTIACKLEAVGEAVTGNGHRGTVDLTISFTTKEGTRKIVLPTIKETSSGPVSDLSKKIGNNLLIAITSATTREITPLNRIRSIDYLTGDIELDFGKDAGLDSGTAYEPLNLDLPAFPDSISADFFKSTLKDKQVDRQAKAQIVLVAKEVKDSTAIARLALLVQRSGQSQIYELSSDDWQEPIRKLLDPGTGLLYVRMLPN